MAQCAGGRGVYGALERIKTQTKDSESQRERGGKGVKKRGKERNLPGPLLAIENAAVSSKLIMLFFRLWRKSSKIA